MPRRRHPRWVRRPAKTRGKGLHGHFPTSYTSISIIYCCMTILMHQRVARTLHPLPRCSHSRARGPLCPRLDDGERRKAPRKAGWKCAPRGTPEQAGDDDGDPRQDLARAMWTLEPPLAAETCHERHAVMPNQHLRWNSVTWRPIAPPRPDWPVRRGLTSNPSATATRGRRPSSPRLTLCQILARMGACAWQNVIR
eukprot:COSAG06_NODE_26_length_32102_cov_250.952911_2_plen_196_part_00